ncbi:MAG: hypothetical protein Q7J47_06905 [Azoarcus sp.]|nr:hypothetical protein [Azoarcus sp.]
MRLITLFLFGSVVAMTGCANPGDRDSKSAGVKGYVVVMSYDGEGVKEGVQGVSDSGMQLFGSALLSKKNTGTYDYPADSQRPFPRWVGVTWREGMTANLPDRKTGRYTTGREVGNHRIDVLNRIPEEAFAYAKTHGALRLQFRIKDDGVLFAWDVRISGGGRAYYAMHGGDFPCDPLPHLPHPVCTTGPLEEAQWFNPNWVRGKL